MLGWLYRVIVGSFKICEHQWEVVNKGDILRFDNIKGHYAVYECTKCRGQKVNKINVTDL